MKVVERIFEHRMRHQIDIDDMQFRFIEGKGTTNAIFIVRQMQKKFRAKGKKLYFGFVDLLKAFDRVSREVIRWAVRKLGVEEWLYWQSCLCILMQIQLYKQFVVTVMVLRLMLVYTKVHH